MGRRCTQHPIKALRRVMSTPLEYDTYSKKMSAKCLNWPRVTRSHTPRQTASPPRRQWPRARRAKAFRLRFFGWAFWLSAFWLSGPPSARAGTRWVRAVKRPAHPYKRAIQNRSAVGNAKGTQPPSLGPDLGNRGLGPRDRRVRARPRGLLRRGLRILHPRPARAQLRPLALPRADPAAVVRVVRCAAVVEVAILLAEQRLELGLAVARR
jgi:hypothetical protein